MFRVKGTKSSAALIVAVIALVAALGGGAVAGVTISKLNSKEKKQVKRLSKKQARKLDRRIELKPGPQGPPGPSTGPAGGDLSGSYPNPEIAPGAVGKENVSSDIPHRRTLELPFSTSFDFQTLLRVGDAELMARCLSSGSNGFLQLRYISPNGGGQVDMTATGPDGLAERANQSQLGPGSGIDLTMVRLSGNPVGAGVGSARVAARAPDGTSLVALVAAHSLGDGNCRFEVLAL